MCVDGVSWETDAVHVVPDVHTASCWPVVKSSMWMTTGEPETERLASAVRTDVAAGGSHVLSAARVTVIVLGVQVTVTVFEAAITWEGGYWGLARSRAT